MSASPPPAPGDPRPDASSAPDAAARMVGTVISDRYRLVELIATGGMGAVYKAEHLLLRKWLAIKLLLPAAKGSPELTARFEREAIAGAHIQHPNIASATDFGTLPDGSRFLVLEYVRGTPLDRIIKSGPVPAARAAEIARQIAAALAAAHERGVVHRDIKPRNILIEQGTDAVKVIDFGLAKVPLERLAATGSDDEAPQATVRITLTGIVFGTLAYMAPEAAQGMEAVGERADLYALGLILYEMLAGKHPFDAIVPVELFHEQCTAAPPPLRLRTPGVEVPRELEALVMRLLRKDPEARPQSARALLAELDAAMPRTDALGLLPWKDPLAAPPSSAQAAFYDPLRAIQPLSPPPLVPAPAAAGAPPATQGAGGDAHGGDTRTEGRSDTRAEGGAAAPHGPMRRDTQKRRRRGWVLAAGALVVAAAAAGALLVHRGRLPSTDEIARLLYSAGAAVKAAAGLTPAAPAAGGDGAAAERADQAAERTDPASARADLAAPPEDLPASALPAPGDASAAQPLAAAKEPAASGSSGALPAGAASAPGPGEALAATDPGEAPAALDAGEARAAADAGEAPAAADPGDASAAPAPVEGTPLPAERARLVEAAKAKRWAEGEEALLVLIEKDPAAFKDRDVMTAAAAIAVKSAFRNDGRADVIFDALENRLGTDGLDVAYEIASGYGGTQGGRRAAELLRRPDVLRRASAPLRIAVELREAPCRSKDALFERASLEGDARALVYLDMLRSPQCQPRIGQCCFRQHAGINRAARALGERLRR